MSCRESFSSSVRPHIAKNQLVLTLVQQLYSKKSILLAARLRDSGRTVVTHDLNFAVTLARPESSTTTSPKSPTTTLWGLEIAVNDSPGVHVRDQVADGEERVQQSKKLKRVRWPAAVCR